MESKIESKVSKELKHDIKRIAKKKAKKAISKHIRKSPHFAHLSAYARTLVDPFTYRGVKIPDLATDPSTCFSIVERQTLTVSSLGVCGFIFGNAFSGPGPTYTISGGLIPSAVGTVQFAYGAQLASTVTAANLIAAPPINRFLPQWGSGSATVPTLFSQVRLVSFGVRIYFTGQALNAQGKITVARAARNTYRRSELSTGNLPLSKLTSLPDSLVASVPLTGGATVVYKPSDFLSMAYTPTNTSQIEDASAIGNEIYVVVDGAVNGQTFFMEAVWNCEGIPVTNQVNLLDVQASESDPVSLSVAANVVSNVPAAAAIPLAAQPKMIASSTQSQEFVAHDHVKPPNLTETLVSGMNDAGKILDAGIGLAGKLSPLLTGALALL